MLNQRNSIDLKLANSIQADYRRPARLHRLTNQKEFIRITFSQLMHLLRH